MSDGSSSNIMDLHDIAKKNGDREEEASNSLEYGETFL